MVAAPETIKASETPASNAEAPNEVPTSSSDPATVEVTPEVPVETPVTKESATELLNLGKRNLFCGNVSEAVNNLSEACAQLDKLYGEQKPECALGYYWYGNALLELARVETDVLGNAMKGIPTSPGRVPEDKEGGVIVEDPDKLTEEEKAEVEQQVSEALDTLAPPEDCDDAEAEEETEGGDAEEGTEGDEAEGEVEGEKDEAMETTDEKAEDKAEKPTEDAESKDEPAEDAADGKDEGESVLSDAETTDDEEDDSLKLAWEMLEMARNVYTASDVENKQEMLSRCYLKLGEVLMETGHHEDADKEFEKSLEIQCNVLTEKCDRAIGEAYFVAGLNMMNAKVFEKSKDYLSKAIACIKDKQTSLSTKKDSLKPETPELTEVENELKELADLLPNMEEKLQDAEAGLKESLKSGFEDSKSGDSDNTTNGKVSDIGHLVKRKHTEDDSKTADKLANGDVDCENNKRKAEEPCEEINGEVCDAKKAKLADCEAPLPAEC
jgi:tetratricopeptide (TPR) repeat protein